MLFFGVFLCESARTAAKSRTNLNTNSGKLPKRLGRVAPNLALMCKFTWEYIYAKQIAPRDTRGTLGGGFAGFNNSKVLGSCPIGTNFGPRLRIHLGMNIGKIQVAPQYPRWDFGGGGGVGCHTFKSLGCQRAGPIGPKFGTHLQIHQGMDISSNIYPFQSPPNEPC